jgi:hypothetical protein
VEKKQIRENDFYPPKCLCLFDYPLYKLRGLSGAVFRACISSFLRRKVIFPHIQELTMQILVQMRGLLCGQRRIWHLRANITEKQSACAPDVHLWGGIPARLCQKSEKKIWMNFSPISGELTGKQVGRGRFVNLQVNEIKRKAK